MALEKGPRPVQVIAAILFVRILSVFLVQSWFVPDEYWQTLEVAHKFAFGYGALTWEWKEGIRSYLVPGIVTVLYTILKYTGLDYPEAVIYLPRILQAILSTAADYAFYKWTGKRKWALFLILTSWFWFYCSGRTLLQSVETALVIFGLSTFPFKDGRLSHYEKESNTWVYAACVCAWVRPSSIPLWGVLAAYNIATTNRGRLALLLRCYLPIAVVMGGALVAFDSFFHGQLVVTPWEFFRLNIMKDIASFYGTHPWHWYLSQCLPAVLGIDAVPALWGLVTVLRTRHNKTGLVLIATAAASIAVYSFIPHKELRYLLPLLPLFLYLAQDVIVPWSRKAQKWQLYLMATSILVGNAVPAVYFGMIHQSGTTAVMSTLREHIAADNNTSIAFLMPCHSTPLYSHLHVNVTTRYLRCDNPASGQVDEAEAFFNNPTHWWRKEYEAKQTPNLVVMFDILKGRLEGVMAGYKQVHELFHTHFPEREVGSKVLVFQKAAPRAARGAPRNDDAL